MASDAPRALLEHALASGRIHSAYLVTGAGDAPREAALAFARGIACRGETGAGRACGACASCIKSMAEEEEVRIDGQGKKGPFYRHLGEHPDLYYVARGAEDTRVRIDQIREVQKALRYASNEGGGRAVIIDDAEWLNDAAQNALLKLLEEPPARTTLLLLAPSATTLFPTIRSRCVRVPFPAEARIALRDEGVDEAHAPLVERLDAIHRMGMPELLDWAEDYRGARASAAEKVNALLEVGGEWLRERVATIAAEGQHPKVALLDAYKTLLRCRRELAQRNANPQMIAERGLIAVREAISR